MKTDMTGFNDEPKCCPSDKSPHLVIVGGGSAAFAASIRATELGARVTMINEGPTGGTCVNVGCVPSKTLIRAAEALHRAKTIPFAGLEATAHVTDFRAVIEEKRALVASLRQAKYVDIANRLPNFRLIQGRATLLDSNRVEVNGQEVSADRILIATGASPRLPEGVPGLLDAKPLNNATAFELEELPESMIVLGGRYVALELAQMFARFGAKVTVLQRSSRILPSEQPDLTHALTGYFCEEGMEIVTGVALESVRRDGGGVVVQATVEGRTRTFHAQELLAATGRRPNTSDMGLEVAGVELDAGGFLKVNDALQTTAKGVFGAGDVIGEPMFVYTAAYEGSLAVENALNGTSLQRDYAPLGWVVFTDPQVAGVGLDEAQAATQGIDAEASTLSLSHVPRSIAARDTRGFIKLIRDRATDRLVGARILAPEGSELLMEAALAIKYGVTVKDLASIFHPYLTLAEGIKLAAITFGKNVESLSCCAT